MPEVIVPIGEMTEAELCAERDRQTHAATELKAHAQELELYRQRKFGGTLPTPICERSV